MVVIIGATITQIEHPHQYVAVANGTTFFYAISGMYSQTTGPKLNPNITLNIMINVRPSAKPAAHSLYNS